MPPKKSKQSKAKHSNVQTKFKSLNKGHKGKKKRKHFRVGKIGYATISYTLLPKRRGLTRNVVKKLVDETDQYMIAHAVDVIKRLDDGRALAGVNEIPTAEEQTWMTAKRTSTAYKTWKENKIIQIHNRALKRRKRAEAKRENELKRKKYRFHPNDPFHKYQEGYKKTRHRISKQRFMKCVDVRLFEDVLNENRELVESPLWNATIHLKNLSVEKAKQLKDHLNQFDVIVESLKQGLFDRPECDDFPLAIVRRKKKRPGQTIHKTKKRKRKITQKNHSSSSSKTRRLKRRLSFPPYEVSNEQLTANEEKVGIIQGAIGALKSLMAPVKHKNSKGEGVAVSPQDNQKSNKGDVPSSVKSTEVLPENNANVKKISTAAKHPFQWGHKTSLKSFPPLQIMSAMSLDQTESYESIDDETTQHAPFNDLLTISVPTGPRTQKKFIRSLVERNTNKSRLSQILHPKSVAIEKAKQEDEARQRHERTEKADPMQILHRDERDSDILTLSSTTTTDGYASWRRPRDIRNAGNRQDILAHKVDTTLGWRIVLLLIVLWEIGIFVKEKVDDVYYWIFTSHLYRENIWLFEPTLFPTAEKYFIIHLQEWIHLIICVICSSIIHRENECVSILFAFALAFDGLMELGISTHDYVYLPDPISWLSVVLTACQVVWKAFLICLFISYHYYCAGYIRMAREFKHRKTKLHNHEIIAKGTKGIQKRRLAWSWMVRHARNTNLRHLKKKYPNVKDGNFPEDKLAKEIRFSEDKELRLYTLHHSLNIGYPYNKLSDMQRYVFQKLEKSDYTDKDDVAEKKTMKKKVIKLSRKTSRALTVTKWRDWQERRIEKEQERRGRVSAAFRKASKVFMTTTSMRASIRGSMRGSTRQSQNEGQVAAATQNKKTKRAPGQLSVLTLDPGFTERKINKLISK